MILRGRRNAPKVFKIRFLFYCFILDNCKVLSLPIKVGLQFEPNKGRVRAMNTEREIGWAETELL